MLEPWTYAVCILVPMLGIAVILAVLRLHRSSKQGLRSSRRDVEDRLKHDSIYSFENSNAELHHIPRPLDVICRDSKRQNPRRVTSKPPVRGPASSYIWYTGIKILATQSTTSLASPLISVIDERSLKPKIAVQDYRLRYAHSKNFRAVQPKDDLFITERALYMMASCDNVLLAKKLDSVYGSRCGSYTSIILNQQVDRSASIACQDNNWKGNGTANGYGPYHYIWILDISLSDAIVPTNPIV